MTGEPLLPLDIPGLLRQYGIRPSKGLGQNFLVSERALRKIVSAAGIGKEDTILEIGPGLGNLTRLLATSARSVTAVELDGKLFPVLEHVLAPYNNVRLIQGDILKMDPVDLMETASYAVVANIPYYITSNVIRHLIESKCPPKRMVLTVQKEVAERICAKPGDMNILAISVQVFGDPVIIDRIPAQAFFPPPRVDSAILAVNIFSHPKIKENKIEDFFSVVKAGFSQKRKTLRNSLSAGMGQSSKNIEETLTGLQIDPQRRAETLSIEEWEKITSLLA